MGRNSLEGSLDKNLPKYVRIDPNLSKFWLDWCCILKFGSNDFSMSYTSLILAKKTTHYQKNYGWWAWNCPNLDFFLLKFGSNDFLVFCELIEGYTRLIFCKTIYWEKFWNSIIWEIGHNMARIRSFIDCFFVNWFLGDWMFWLSSACRVHISNSWEG